MCVKTLLKTCKIKTRLDVLFLIISLYIVVSMCVFKIFPHKFNVNWTKNKTQIYKVDLMHDDNGNALTKYEGKAKFFKLLGKTDEQILSDKIATVYLYSAWTMPHILPMVFNNSIIGGYYNLSLMSTYVVSKTMKAVVGKKRPDGSNYRSFPSGHTSGTAVLGGFIHRFHGIKIGAPFYILSLATGISRIYADRHDIYDVVAGFTIGSACGYYTNAIALLFLGMLTRRYKFIKKICDFFTKPI